MDDTINMYDFDALLTPTERDVRSRVRRFCDEEIIPIIHPYWERGIFPWELIPKLAELNIVGSSIQGYGCPGLSTLTAALVSLELARGDGSVNGFFGVTSNLAMGSIYAYGSEEQRQQWLPAMARLEKIGAFGLTEPDTGSDAAHLQTTAQRRGNCYILNGTKRWIGNATIADVTVIWARNNETNRINGFLVEKDTPGFEATLIHGKTSLRALQNADIVLTNCEIPVANRLANATSFRDTAVMLMQTRIGAAAAAVGHALAAVEYTQRYLFDAQQRGPALVASALIQQRLVEMIGAVSSMQLLVWRLCKLCDEGKLTQGRSALAKYYCAGQARHVVALARELLGNEGLLLSSHLARHFVDMEGVYTYEGTNDISSLIVGREITGIQAFI